MCSVPLLQEDDKMAKIFISHSSKDKKFVRELASDLEKLGHKPWLDEREIKTGESIPSKIEQGISKADYMIVVLSKDSVKSEWVKKELQPMHMYETEQKKKLILPVLISDCKIPPLLKPIKYADFRKSYSVGLVELMEKIKNKGIEDQERIVFLSREADSTFDKQLKDLLPKANHVRLCGWSLKRTIDKHHDGLRKAKQNNCEFRILLLKPGSITVEILDSVISDENPECRIEKGLALKERSSITEEDLDKVIRILSKNEIISGDIQNDPVLHFCGVLLPFAMAMIEYEGEGFWASVQVYPLHPDMQDDDRLQFRLTDPDSSLWKTLKKQFDLAWKDQPARNLAENEEFEEQ